MNKEYKIHLVKVKEDLEKISPSFCVAKWKQVTVHLQTGHTHSCHHPSTHKIPLDEIKDNPTALHNTKFKKSLRKEMIEGTRPKECEYCWKVEDTGNLSDRIHKSADTQWASDQIQDILNDPYGDIDPSYMEVSFSNVCNFKCSYCSPSISSQWMSEIEKFGAYPTSRKYNDIAWLTKNDLMPIPNNHENVYIDAFWKWWPTLYRKLKIFRITGGEPLLNKNTFKILDYIIENPNPELHISINSNLCIPEELFNEFLEKIKIISTNKLVKTLKVFTSAEAPDIQSEYIRHGMNYSLWLQNVETILRDLPLVNLTIMSTYNIFSVPNYDKFLEDILKFKRTYVQPGGLPRILLDIPYLRYPEHQSVFILPPEFCKTVEDQIMFMNNNIEIVDSSLAADKGFMLFEIDKLKRIYSMMCNNVEDNNTSRLRKDFVLFVDEHDRRRGSKFLETFPALSNIYYQWKQL